MTFDALAMHAIRDEIEHEVVGGHVDAAFLVDERRLALEIFNRKRVFLVFCADPADSRVYLTTDRVRARTNAITPFLLLVRKYLRGSRLLSIEQPRLERLYRLQFASATQDGPPRQVALYVESMGRRSNLVLVDEDGAIMDALFRAPPSANPVRSVLPHLRYQPPPRAQKHDPTEPGLAAILEEAAAQHTALTASLLVAQVDGLSPLAAREALARSGEDPNGPADSVQSWKSVADALGELGALAQSGAWEPCVAWDDGTPLAFAPYPLHQFPQAVLRQYRSMSEVVALAGGPRVSSPPLERLKRPLIDALAARIETTRRKRSSLERSLAAADRADQLREAGEAILSSLHRIEPGAAALDWNGTRIDLYPTLSGAENAQAYFRQYADARGARQAVPPLLDAVAAELDYLDEMAVHVELTQSEGEIGHLRRELEAQGVVVNSRPGRPGESKRRKAATLNGVVRRLRLGDAEILVGASAQGNENVTFRLAQPDDLWFHARGVPGAHVVLKTPGEPSAKWIDAAARLAAQNCAARTDAHVEVDYTLRKYVRKIRGAAPGRVTYRRESTVAIDPSEPETDPDA